VLRRYPTQAGTKKFEAEQQPARAFDRGCLLACLAISTFLVAWITLASGRFNLRSAVFLLVLPWVLIRAGGIITAALRLPSFFALDFLLGVAVVSVGVMAWKIFVPFSLWVPLITILIAVATIPKLLPHPNGLAVDRKENRLYIASTRIPNMVYEFLPCCVWRSQMLTYRYTLIKILPPL
jgi:hypothetical protein